MLETQHTSPGVSMRPETRTSLPLWQWNRRIGWLSMCLGIASGLIMGMWSFDGPFAVPAWLGQYDDTSRRLARLGHIAFIGLGILNLLIAGELRRFLHSFRGRTVLSWAMNFGNIFLPLTLFASAAYRPCKFIMSVPALAVFVALVVTTYGVWCGRASCSGEEATHEPCP
jgi:hypothetical protein